MPYLLALAVVIGVIGTAAVILGWALGSGLANALERHQARQRPAPPVIVRTYNRPARHLEVTQ